MTETSRSRLASGGPLIPAGIGRDLAYHDDLTGLYNRRLLAWLMDKRWQDLTAEPPFSVIMIDLDLFKQVNDTYGHLTGDEVLRVAATTLQASFRRDDVIVRYGGDEFVVVLPGAGPVIAEGLAERTRVAMQTHHLTTDRGEPIELPVSFSIGRASYPADGEDPDAILARADERLYEEKRSRRPVPRTPPLTRIGLLGIGLVLAALLGATWLARNLERQPDLDVAIPVAPAAVAAGSGGEELRQQIRELEALVAGLQSNLAQQRAQGEQGEVYAERIAELEATLTQLRNQQQTGPVAEAPPTAPESPPPSPGLETDPGPPSLTPAPTPATASPSAPASLPPVLVLPRLVEHDTPVYPRLARELRREATIELDLVVGADGRVIAAEPIGPPVGMGFEPAAVAAAMSATYEAGTSDGTPAEMRTRLTVRFSLN